MGRLTQKDDKGNWSLRNIPWGELFEGGRIEPKARQVIYGALCKLKEYEDTGLEPGNLQEMDEEYQKLAKEVAGLREKERWIPCSERLPEERESIFAKLKGTEKWRNAMFEKTSNEVNATIEFEDGKRAVKTLRTIDGRWNEGDRGLKFKVIAWRPLPEPHHES